MSEENNASKQKTQNIFAAIYKDWFPPSRNVQEDGIHAKLNYQNIADSQRRSMSILLVVIVIIAFVFSWMVYQWSISDVLIEKEDIGNYSLYMKTIRREVLGEKVNPNTKASKIHQDTDLSNYYESKYEVLRKFDTLMNTELENERLGYIGKIDSLKRAVQRESERSVGPLTDEESMLEGNTGLYWGVFFTRFLLVRILIGVTIGIIITFLIRIYFRIRHDRAVNIHKEEALSTIQYVARGEWRLKYDEDQETYVEVPYIENNESRVLSTNDFLKTLPIATLFKAPNSEKKRRGGRGKSDKELIDTMRQIVTTLSKIEEDLRGKKQTGI